MLHPTPSTFPLLVLLMKYQFWSVRFLLERLKRERIEQEAQRKVSTAIAIGCSSDYPNGESAVNRTRVRNGTNWLRSGFCWAHITQQSLQSDKYPSSWQWQRQPQHWTHLSIDSIHKRFTDSECVRVCVIAPTFVSWNIIYIDTTAIIASDGSRYLCAGWDISKLSARYHSKFQRVARNNSTYIFDTFWSALSPPELRWTYFLLNYQHFDALFHTLRTLNGTNGSHCR